MLPQFYHVLAEQVCNHGSDLRRERRFRDERALVVLCPDACIARLCLSDRLRPGQPGRAVVLGGGFAEVPQGDRRA